VRQAKVDTQAPTCDLGKPPSTTMPPVSYNFAVTNDLDGGAAMPTGGDLPGTYVAKKITFIYPTPIASLLNIDKSSLNGSGWVRLAKDGHIAFDLSFDLMLDTNIIGKTSFDSEILLDGKYSAHEGNLHLDIACPDPKTLPFDLADSLQYSTKTDGAALRVYLTQTPQAIHYPVTLVIDFDAVPEA
jgi:hypothetical protein